MRSHTSHFITLLAAFFVGLVIPVSATAGEACRVEFTEVQIEPYQSGGRTMHRLRIRGEHNYDPATNTGGAAKMRFDITDGDGFFVMAVFANRWGGGGRGGDLSARTVRIPRTELDSVGQAVAIGDAYYTRGQEILMTPPLRANSDDLLAHGAKKQRLLNEIRAMLDEAESHPSSTPAESVVSLTWFDQQMARFRVGGDLRSQYRDNLIEGAPPNLLCGADARNAVVGRLACPPAFPAASGTAATNATCPDGLMFSALVIPATGP